MSSEDTEERKQYVQQSPNSPGTVVVEQPARTAPVAAPAQVIQNVPASQKTVVSHRTTNTGALIAMAVGIVVLLAGIGLIASQVRFLPYPYSLIVILGFGLILLLAGLSMIDRGSEP